MQDSTSTSGCIVEIYARLKTHRKIKSIKIAFPALIDAPPYRAHMTYLYSYDRQDISFIVLTND